MKKKKYKKPSLTQKKLTSQFLRRNSSVALEDELLLLAQYSY